MDMDIVKKCIICDKPCSLCCSRCKSATYCSELCRLGDYPIHNLLCAEFAAFDVSKRPTVGHFRAIVFPENSPPKLVWLLQGPGSTQLHAYYNPVLGRPLSNQICVLYHMQDGSALNKTITTITDATPGPHQEWRGTIVAYAKFGMDLDPAHPAPCKDVDMHDFRHIADYFTSFNSDRASLFHAVSQVGVPIKCVKINCVGDQKMFNKPPFEEIEMSETDINCAAVFDTSEIADLIDLPIFTKRYFPHPNWANAWNQKLYGAVDPYDNKYATYLHLCCDPQLKGDISLGFKRWGLAPAQWQFKVGSTIVMRQDKKPLSRWHVEALCRFCRFVGNTYLSHSRGLYKHDEPMPEDLALSIICRPSFSIFYYNMIDVKRRQGVTVDVPIPYLV